LYSESKILEYKIDRTSYSSFGASTFKGNVTTHSTLVGYQYTSDSTLQLSAGNQRLQGKNNAYWHDYVGITHTHKVGSISLVEAIRYDNYDKFKDATTGKVGIKIPLVNLASLSANYGTSYNAPSAFQVGYGQTQNLKPESTTGWDITLNAFGAFLTYFDQETQDAIVYGGVWPNDYYTNASGKTTYKGWQFGYQRSFNDLALNLNYSWLEARNDQGQLLGRRPQQEGSVMLDYYGFSKWHLGTVIRHVGDYYDTDGTSGENLGNYTLIDANIDYMLNKHFTIYAKAINLFNVDYYTATDQNNPPQYGYNTGGFQWRVGLRGNF
jgi:vitamin B12 transporter